MFTNVGIEQLRRVMCATEGDEQSSDGTERNPWDLSLALVEQAGQLRLTLFQVRASIASEEPGTTFNCGPNSRQQLARQLSEVLLTVVQLAAGCDVDLGRAVVELVAQRTAQRLKHACAQSDTDQHSQRHPVQLGVQLAGNTPAPESRGGGKCGSRSSATTSAVVSEGQQQLPHGIGSGAASSASSSQFGFPPTDQCPAADDASNNSMCRSHSAADAVAAAILPGTETSMSPNYGAAGSLALTPCQSVTGGPSPPPQQQQHDDPAGRASVAALANATGSTAEFPASADSQASILSAADEVVLPVAKSAGFVTRHLAAGAAAAGGVSGGGRPGTQQAPHIHVQKIHDRPGSGGCYTSRAAYTDVAGQHSGSTTAATASASGSLWLTGAVSPDLQGLNVGSSASSSSNSSTGQQSGSVISPCSSDSSNWSTTAALSSVLRSGALQNPTLVHQTTLDSVATLDSHTWQDVCTTSYGMSHNMLGTNALMSHQLGVPALTHPLQNVDITGLGLLSSSGDAGTAYAAAAAAALSSPAAALAAAAQLSAISPMPSPMPRSLSLSGPISHSHGISSSGSSGAMCLTPNLNLAAAAAARVASESPLVHSLGSNASRLLALDPIPQSHGMTQQQSPLLFRSDPAAAAAATVPCCSRCGGSHYGKCPPRAKCLRCYRKAHLGECWTRCVRCNLVHAPDKCKVRPQQQCQQQQQQQVTPTSVRRADTA